MPMVKRRGQGLAMDFSRLHTYTPPLCTPDNTGYTYSLSSSYSTAALEFEKEHNIKPVFDSPRMSRRSLRLHTSSGLYGESSSNHGAASHQQAGSVNRSARGRRKQRGSAESDAEVTSESLIQTPQISLNLSDLSFTSTASDATLISSLLDQSSLRHTHSGRSRAENGGVCRAESSADPGNGFSRLERSEETRCVSYCQSDDALTHTLNNGQKTAHDSYCSSVNVRGVATAEKHLDLNGSLCDDCKGKHHVEVHSAGRRRSRSHLLLAAAWAVLCFTGGVLMRGWRGVVSAGAALSRKTRSVLRAAVCSPGRATGGALWWLGSGWYQLVGFMSLLNVFLLTRCFPRVLKLLLLLLPFLLLFELWHLGLPFIWSRLPEENVTSITPSAAEERLVLQAAPERLGEERLARLEQKVSALWDSVQQGELKTSQKQEDTWSFLQLLQKQIDTQTDRQTLGLWVSQLLQPQFSALKGEVERQAASRAQAEERQVQQQTSVEARLADAEMLLKNLISRTEELHRTQEASTSPAPTPPLSAAVSLEKQDALLAEVQRLDAQLERIRGDLLGVMECRDKCHQLDTLQQTVSAQVKAELQAQLYGRDGAGLEVPEPLVPWLSSQYARSSDLAAALVSLERSILGNVSLLLRERAGQMPSAEAVTQTVTQTVATGGAAAAGVSQEQVQEIVRRALKLFSEDRTGLFDYALESGGGSILSTRCSETFETKTALMSLFGMPLWYFSQSPRAVIQPDVHPGNCWAFKGSQGYLVIRLSLPVVPTSFALEHIPKSLSPSGLILSAPRRFTVHGLDSELQEEGKLLGDYTYQEDGDALQIFPVLEQNQQAFQIMEVRVLSNWGHPEYTCVYRVRVHGTPPSP